MSHDIDEIQGLTKSEVKAAKKKKKPKKKVRGGKK